MHVGLESAKGTGAELERHLLFLLWLSEECKKRAVVNLILD
ncbi:hypothetical protein [Pampinifervens florentissimum]|nr:hypothetical protein [Hydrogenobacter sp. T-8]